MLIHTSRFMADTFEARQAFFFLFQESGRPIIAGTEGHSKLAAPDAEWLGGFFEATHKASVRPGLRADDHLRKLLKSYRLELVAPLRRQQEIIGYICLGEPARKRYARRHIGLLESVVDELSIAVQNVQSIQVVKELNAHLEQRVEAATQQLRASNAQLQRLDEAKDEFISMASHQLRTPLTSIKGYLSMLIEGDLGKVSKEQKQVLNEAFVSSERMVRLIGDFLNVSRLQTGKFVIDKHPVNLVKLVEREIEGLTQNAATRGIAFRFTPPKRLPLLDLDENKIQQVVMNFCDNAIFYSKDGSTIKVALKKTAGAVEFIVKDTGIGVPPDEQKHLFTKFFRATNARKARPDGTGVGLFLAKKVVRDHGGEIIFESKEGKGSTFGFRIPIK